MQRGKNQRLEYILHIYVDSYRFVYYNESQQDAQLSQRDRAAGCVIVLAKSRRLELGVRETIFYGHYRSIFNHYDIIGLKICQIR